METNLTKEQYKATIQYFKETLKDYAREQRELKTNRKANCYTIHYNKIRITAILNYYHEFRGKKHRHIADYMDQEKYPFHFNRILYEKDLAYVKQEIDQFLKKLGVEAA